MGTCIHKSVEMVRKGFSKLCFMSRATQFQFSGRLLGGIWMAMYGPFRHLPGLVLCTPVCSIKLQPAFAYTRHIEWQNSDKPGFGDTSSLPVTATYGSNHSSSTLKLEYRNKISDVRLGEISDMFSRYTESSAQFHTVLRSLWLQAQTMCPTCSRQVFVIATTGVDCTTQLVAESSMHVVQRYVINKCHWSAVQFNISSQSCTCCFCGHLMTDGQRIYMQVDFVNADAGSNIDWSFGLFCSMRLYQPPYLFVWILFCP